MLKIAKIDDSGYKMGVRFKLINGLKYGFAITEIIIVTVNAYEHEVEILPTSLVFEDDYDKFCELAFDPTDNNIIERLESYYCMKINTIKWTSRKVEHIYSWRGTITRKLY